MKRLVKRLIPAKFIHNDPNANPLKLSAKGIGFRAKKRNNEFFP